jgi:acetylornithine deacetylase/succinyl-diaminopimelate desuccinylase-like protein
MILAAAVLLLAPPPLGREDGALEVARAHRSGNGAAVLEELAELLRIPNVPADPKGLRRTAEYCRALLAARGARAELLEVDGAPPLVWGRLDTPGGAATSRTLGIYVHYDGQPVQTAAWTFPPFEPTLTTRALEAGGERRAFPGADEPIDPEWRVYARGAGDDKAPIVAITAALDALDAAGLARSSNLVFLFEGEEERGSPHLGEALARYADRLVVDAWLICDGPVHQSRRPQIVFGVRGVTTLELTVYGAARNLHSGHYGNWAPNPAMMLARLLATMKNAEGDVLIEGFYDSIDELTPGEREALASVPAVDVALMRELGLARTEGGEGAGLTERLLLPSLNVRGLAAAEVGEQSRNVIPREATASIDIRLVKGNDPVHMSALVVEHVRSQGYRVVDAEPDLEMRRKHPRIARITRSPGYPAARAPMDHPIADLLVAAAGRASGQPVVRLPSLGGSLPLYLFGGSDELPVVIVPIANHDDNQHAPDENLRIANLWYGIDLFALVFTM